MLLHWIICHKFNALKQHAYFLLQFWKLEVWSQLYWIKVKVLDKLHFLLKALRDNPFLCLFSFWKSSIFLGWWLLPSHHSSFLLPSPVSTSDLLAPSYKIHMIILPMAHWDYPGLSIELCPPNSTCQLSSQLSYLRTWLV